MARSSLEYRKQMQSLLPKGRLWKRSDYLEITKLLYGLAEEFSRIEGRAENLINEKILSITSELIAEHEEDYGLPEEGEELQPTLSGRRSELISKMLTVGAQNPNYFIEICASFGYIIKVTQFRPAWCGVMVAGDPCGDQNNLFFWKIEIYIESIYNENLLYSFGRGFSSDFLNGFDFKRDINNVLVNLTKIYNKMYKLRPAHSHLLMDWYNADFDRGFNEAFNRFYHYDNYWYDKDFGRCFDDSFTNAYDYTGVNYTGSFNYGFSIDYDRNSGGSFEKDSFSNEFTRPS